MSNVYLFESRWHLDPQPLLHFGQLEARSPETQGRGETLQPYHRLILVAPCLPPIVSLPPAPILSPSSADEGPFVTPESGSSPPPQNNHSPTSCLRILVRKNQVRGLACSVSRQITAVEPALHRIVGAAACSVIISHSHGFECRLTGCRARLSPKWILGGSRIPLLFF